MEQHVMNYQTNNKFQEKVENNIVGNWEEGKLTKKCSEITRVD